MNRPNREALFRFIRAESPPAETRSVVGWLLESGVVHRPEPEPAIDPGGYDRALADGHALLKGLRSAETVLPSRREGRVVVEVAAMSAAALRQAHEELVATLDLRSWTVCNHLLDAVAAAVLDDPERGEALAALAIALMEGLIGDEADGDGATVDLAGIDLHALALGSLANARRVKGDLAAAEKAFDRARARLGEGTGDPLIEARLIGFLVSQRRDQRRLGESRRLAQRGARLARRVGDAELEARFKLKISTILWNQGEPEKAIATLEAARLQIDQVAWPRLAALVRQNLISSLVSAGRADEAHANLEEAHELMAAAGGPLDQARIVWLEGRVAAHRGDLDHAERCYGSAREAFLAREIGTDAALINLELADVYLERGELAKVRELAAAMVPVFAARDVHREAQAALRMFCEAARTEQAEKAMVAELRSYLERSRRDPSLRFRQAP